MPSLQNWASKPVVIAAALQAVKLCKLEHPNRLYVAHCLWSTASPWNSFALGRQWEGAFSNAKPISSRTQSETVPGQRWGQDTLPMLQELSKYLRHGSCMNGYHIINTLRLFGPCCVSGPMQSWSLRPAQTCQWIDHPFNFPDRVPRSQWLFLVTCSL